MKLRVCLVAVLLVLVGAWRVREAHASGPTNATRQPVIVELFTSEGCSSCPPADALLIKLDELQPIPGADVIALGQHVDYWNHDGWTDRFSSHEITDRQDEYARRFDIKGPYTPEMVIDGRYQMVGNDGAKIQKALIQAASEPKPATVQLQRSSADDLHVEVANAGKNSPQVMFAITESGLSSSVRAGENTGHELHHTAVVREMRALGKAKDGHFAANVPLKLKSDWKRDNLRAVVFVQEHGLHDIIGAASLPLK